MAVPHVSPENYGRVRTFAQIELGGESPRVEDLSFDDQLMLIIVNTGGIEQPLSLLDEILKMDNPIHPGWVTEVEITIPRETSRGKRRRAKDAQKVEEKREDLGERLEVAMSVSDEFGVSVEEVVPGAYEKMKEQQQRKKKESEVKKPEEGIDIEELDEAFQGKVKEMPTFRVAVADRNRPHRPEVSDKTERALRAAVQELRPRVPAGAFDFDEVLSVFLDELQQRYEEMALELKAVEWVR